ncbi:signal recognition particle protein [Candidatus Cyanaurora vandensis]|uniref:signal recognition particle protein n=1 Tax=Candidatus Cyanaurora vandensis TaxID=2714958 RepID=UPI002579A9FD|nr:signal recognition particle protein [Candidatus Cyanaurora vandensis]
MFEALTEKFESAFKSIKGEGKLTEQNIAEPVRTVRRALLEADVNLQIVKQFEGHIKEKALGKEVLLHLSPAQQFMHVVYQELVELMGEANVPLAKTSPRIGDKPVVVLMAGLQGAGKTTACAKLALFLKKEKLKVLLTACDVYRPAAIDQLLTLGRQIQTPVYSEGTDARPVDIARNALSQAQEQNFDVLIVDTAGRLQIDETLMGELVQIKEVLQPDEVLLVVDAMTGQEAANLTRSFHERIGITGAVLTKMDGDTLGGAALSVRQISGQPIKFIGVGEKVEALQPFYPERMASRILGSGDILTLVERAQEEIDITDAKQMEEKILKAQFNLEDFVGQMRMIKRMGSLGGVLKMIPGMNKISDDQIEQGEVQLKRTEAMINSMTREERKNPGIIDNARKRRVAKGSGVSIQDVGKMLNDFETMRTMMQQFGQMGGMGGGAPGVSGGPRLPRPSSLGPSWRGQGKPRPPKGGDKKKKGKGFGK